MWTEDCPQIRSFLVEKCLFLDYKISPLTGDASARKYFRVSKNNNEHYILMAWEPFKTETFAFFNVGQHFKNHKIGVPEVICFDESLGLVLLEDLGDTTLAQIFSKALEELDTLDTKPYKPYYDQAIIELTKIHFDASLDRASSCIAFDLDFDIEKLSWELNFTKSHLFEKLLKHKFSNNEDSIFTTSIFQISKTLHEQPKYIQHRDYHSRNLMIKDSKVRVIDFQDARMGIIQYDLVSLFKDSYVDFPPDLELSYLRSYFLEACSRGYSIRSFDHFLKIYNLQAIQRCLKACGSFASFYNLKNDQRYLHYIAPTLDKVENLLFEFKEFKEFAKMISHLNRELHI